MRMIVMGAIGVVLALAFDFSLGGWLAFCAGIIGLWVAWRVLCALCASYTMAVRMEEAERRRLAEM